jgi:hypothetical protein
MNKRNREHAGIRGGDREGTRMKVRAIVMRAVLPLLPALMTAVAYAQPGATPEPGGAAAHLTTSIVLVAAGASVVTIIAALLLRRKPAPPE